MKHLLLLLILFSSCKPFVSADCDYPVTYFKLKQNGNGQWGIVNESTGSVLGYSTRYFNYGFYPYDANEVMTFSDSCKAKGLLKKYMNDKYKNSFK